MKIYSQIILLFFSIGSVAQNKETKEADKLFDSYEYVSAAKAYLSLVENGNNSAYVYEHLADSYYKIENTIDAEKWYAETLKSSKDADTYYKYVRLNTMRSMMRLISR
jgi:tetratricopeptide (TPR) repeat protein